MLVTSKIHSNGVSNLELIVIVIAVLFNSAVFARDINRDLVDAALVGDADSAAALLKQGADANAAGEFGKSALMFAAEVGNDEVVKLLVEHGANINPRSSSGCTALTYAAENGHLVLVDYLLDKGAKTHPKTRAGWDALAVATRYGHNSILATLIAHGANVNTSDKDGVTALMAAAERADLRAIELLLDADADTHVRNKDGLSAMMIAACKGHDAAVDFLLKRGANVNAVDNTNSTALFCAADAGHIQVIELLLKNGANIDQRNSEGETPLFAATLNAQNRTFVLHLSPTLSSCVVAELYLPLAGLFPNHVPTQIITPAAAYKGLECRALISNATTWAMPGIKNRFIGPGEENFLHILHGQHESFWIFCCTWSADKECISDNNTPIAQIEADCTRRVTWCVDGFQAQVPNENHIPIRKRNIERK